MKRYVRILALLLLPALVLPAPAGILFNKKPKVAPAQPEPVLRVPELLYTVKMDSDERKRVMAAEELRTFDPRMHPEIVPVLQDVVHSDKNSSVRSEAKQTLNRLGVQVQAVKTPTPIPAPQVQMQQPPDQQAQSNRWQNRPILGPVMNWFGRGKEPQPTMTMPQGYPLTGKMEEPPLSERVHAPTPVSAPISGAKTAPRPLPLPANANVPLALPRTPPVIVEVPEPTPRRPGWTTAVPANQQQRPAGGASVPEGPALIPPQ